MNWTIRRYTVNYAVVDDVVKEAVAVAAGDTVYVLSRIDTVDAATRDVLGSSWQWDVHPVNPWSPTDGRGGAGQVASHFKAPFVVAYDHPDRGNTLMIGMVTKRDQVYGNQIAAGDWGVTLKETAWGPHGGWITPANSPVPTGAALPGQAVFDMTARAVFRDSQGRQRVNLFGPVQRRPSAHGQGIVQLYFDGSTWKLDRTLRAPNSNQTYELIPTSAVVVTDSSGARKVSFLIEDATASIFSNPRTSKLWEFFYDFGATGNDWQFRPIHH
jgi:hypothetical protein